MSLKDLKVGDRAFVSGTLGQRRMLTVSRLLKKYFEADDRSDKVSRFSYTGFPYPSPDRFYSCPYVRKLTDEIEQSILVESLRNEVLKYFDKLKALDFETIKKNILWIVKKS